MKMPDARTHRRTDAAGRLFRAPVRLCVCASVFLAACGAPGRTGIAASTMAADSADQIIWGMNTALTKEGVEQAYVSADTAYLYEASGRADLRHVKVTFYTSQGVPESVLTGKTGTYWMRTNNMSARGDVVVVRSSDGARLKTDFLEYDPAQNQVRTDKPYVADNGPRHIEGIGFVCDPGFTNCATQQNKGNAGQLVMPAR
jgi:LPS export ABC transporter protein LptC